MPNFDDSNSRVARLRRLLAPIPWRFVRTERLHHRTHDRYLLEEIIFPALRSRTDMTHILFVGCAEYTASYPSAFADRQFTTLDVDPVAATYGAERHIVDRFENVQAHFRSASLDGIICNGVVGWGLDRADDLDRALRGSHEALRPGGIFILGWNDMDPWRPIELDSVEALDLFTATPLPPFPSAVYPTLGAMRHVFNFYERPKRDARD